MKLLVTEECARLARWLRLCGYDTVVLPAQPPTLLYRRAYEDERIVVTRNHRVKASCLFRVVHLDHDDLTRQLQQLVSALRLTVDQETVLTRCDRCNVALESIEKSQAKTLVPPYVFQTQDKFTRCPSCQRIYWMATHCDRIHARLQRVLRPN